MSAGHVAGDRIRPERHTRGGTFSLHRLPFLW